MEIFLEDVDYFWICVPMNEEPRGKPRGSSMERKPIVLAGAIPR